MSKRLREHLAGGASMTPSQLQRAVNKITSHWSEILLAKLYDRAMQSMGKDLHPDMDLDDPKIRHAVMMQFSVAENRRALRKTAQGATGW